MYKVPGRFCPTVPEKSDLSTSSPFPRSKFRLRLVFDSHWYELRLKHLLVFSQSSSQNPRPLRLTGDITLLLQMADPTESSGCPRGFDDVPNQASSPSTPVSTLNPFVPPTPSDLRSPCPGLNALANHGYMYVTIVATFSVKLD